MKRAYSLIEMKGLNNDTREFEGLATTPTPDRMGDIVEPLGAQFNLPIPLLWQHRSDQPIGEVHYAKATSTGIQIKGRVFKASQSRTLMERLDEAWESLALKLVRGLSIGFQPIEEAQIKDTWSYRYIKWDWLELSAVTIPANAEASIQHIKSADRRILAASGRMAIYGADELRRVSRKKGAFYLRP